MHVVSSMYDFNRICLFFSYFKTTAHVSGLSSCILYVLGCYRLMDQLHEVEDTIVKKFRAVLLQSLLTPGA